jgi:hypothetical protein
LSTLVPARRFGSEVAAVTPTSEESKAVVLDYFGIPSTGKPVTIRFVEIFTVRDDKIAEIWHAANVLDVMQQLGLMPKGGIPAPIMAVFRLRSRLRRRRAARTASATV